MTGQTAADAHLRLLSAGGAARAELAALADMATRRQFASVRGIVLDGRRRAGHAGARLLDRRGLEFWVLPAICPDTRIELDGRQIHPAAGAAGPAVACHRSTAPDRLGPVFSAATASRQPSRDRCRHSPAPKSGPIPGRGATSSPSSPPTATGWRTAPVPRVRPSPPARHGRPSSRSASRPRPPHDPRPRFGGPRPGGAASPSRPPDARSDRRPFGHPAVPWPRPPSAPLPVPVRSRSGQ